VKASEEGLEYGRQQGREAERAGAKERVGVEERGGGNGGGGDSVAWSTCTLYRHYAQLLSSHLADKRDS
jgi:hypothetical protein